MNEIEIMVNNIDAIIAQGLNHKQQARGGEGRCEWRGWVFDGWLVVYWMGFRVSVVHG